MEEKKHLFLLLLIPLTQIQILSAQSDYNFTQFQNTPFLTNPAMIATSNDIKLLLNYRHQPNVTGNNFETVMFTGIYPIINRSKGKRWAGIGASFLNDKAGEFLKTNAGLLAFALNQKLGFNRFGENFLSLGLQGGLFQRRLSLDGLNTSSQYQSGSFRPNEFPDIGEAVDNLNQNYAVLSTGLQWYAMDTLGRSTAFLGLSLFNFNHPQTAYYEDRNHRLPEHWNLTGGVRVLNTERYSLTPNFRWVIRSGNDQVSAGSWFNYYVQSAQKTGIFKDGTASVGVWYNFNDAFEGALQFETAHYLLTLSFDLPTAKTSNVWQGSNAFELTLGLKLPQKTRRRTFWTMDTLQNMPMAMKVEQEKTIVKMAYVPVPTKPHKKPETKPGFEDGAFRFKFNSDELDDYSKALLDSVTQVLMEFPEATIEVSGHTCDIGTDEANMRLSQRRAASVKKYLSEYDGVDPKRIVTAGYGESRPLVPNLNEANRIKNRRVAFKIKFPENKDS